MSVATDTPMSDVYKRALSSNLKPADMDNDSIMGKLLAIYRKEKDFIISTCINENTRNPTYYECKKCSNVLVNSGKKLHDIQCFTNENEESSFSEISSNNYKNKFKVEVSSGSPAYNAKMAAILKNYRDEVNKIIADFKVGKRSNNFYCCNKCQFYMHSYQIFEHTYTCKVKAFLLTKQFTQKTEAEYNDARTKNKCLLDEAEIEKRRREEVELMIIEDELSMLLSGKEKKGCCLII